MVEELKASVEEKRNTKYTTFEAAKLCIELKLKLEKMNISILEL